MRHLRKNCALFPIAGPFTSPYGSSNRFVNPISILHDGRTSDLVDAIRAHRANTKYQASEATGSVGLFNGLDERAKQNLLNFLRSL